jgi:hypothetical protein
MKQLVVALLLLTSAAVCQNLRYGPRGPIPNAFVAVCTQPANTSVQPCTPAAPLCSSLSDASCTSSNRLQSDALGNYHFYVKGSVGVFTIQVYGPQVIAPIALVDQGSFPSTTQVLNTVYYPATCGSSSTAPPWCSGSEMGAWVNAAYAACPSFGCRIHITAQSSCYSFTTPIALNTNNKPAMLDGDGSGSTCLNYTPTTGTAITIDYGSSYPGAGIRDLELRGPGSSTTTTGVSVGPSNGAINPRLSGFLLGGDVSRGFSGFGTGILFNGGLGFEAQITNSAIWFEGTGVSVTGAAGSENLMISDSVFADNTTAYSNTTANMDTRFAHVSFDNNGTGISINNSGTTPQPNVSCEGCHFENPSGGTGASAYVVISNGTLNMTNSLLLDDRSSGSSTQMISASGWSTVSILSTQVFSNGITVSEIVNFAGHARGIVQFTQTSPAIPTFNSSYTAAPVFDLSSNTSAVPPITANNAPVQAVNFTSGGALPTLTGTGACATITTQAGGSTAGTFKCTGTTGASTVTLTLGPTAPNGWTCWANDITHTLSGSQSTASATAPVMTFSSVTANDVLNFGCLAY